ncbi:MAG: hypothetical protein P8X57_04285 [Cyclobacteriaceae bacterium]
MPSCAFLSIANTHGWFIDDDLVHAPLRELGWNVMNIPWDQDANWEKYDVVVIRSAWDYQDHLSDFIEVLQSIDRSGAILLNELDIVRWNINKNYLFDLENRGVEIIPSISFHSPGKQDILNAFDELNSEELIIKPIIGANADDTYRLYPDQAESMDDILDCFNDRTCLIQPFIKNIIDEGEFSVMYFNGQVSHTVLKTARKGDYRIQEEHGGGVHTVQRPNRSLLKEADRAMSALEFTPLYARVDLIRTQQNGFALMELELIEPSLYFRFDKESVSRFARCIHDRYTGQ